VTPPPITPSPNTPPPGDDREILPQGVEQASDESTEQASDASVDNPFGSIDLGSLLDQAQRLQEQLVSAQAAAADTVVEGRAGGGKVVVTMSGEGEPLSVRIDPGAVDPAELDLLEDLVLAAMRDAVDQARSLSHEALGGLGDLLGGADRDLS